MEYTSNNTIKGSFIFFTRWSSFTVFVGICKIFQIISNHRSHTHLFSSIIDKNCQHLDKKQLCFYANHAHLHRRRKNNNKSQVHLYLNQKVNQIWPSISPCLICSKLHYKDKNQPHLPNEPSHTKSSYSLLVPEP